MEQLTNGSVCQIYLTINSFFNTVRLYCIDIVDKGITENFADYTTCDANGCPNAEQCDIEQCMDDWKAQNGINTTFPPTCDYEFEWIDNLVDYCTKKINDPVLTETCSVNPCQEDTCCKERCDNNPYLVVCQPSLQDFFTKEEYCQGICFTPNFDYEPCFDENNN